MKQNLADYEIEEYVMLRVWPTFEPWVRWNTKWRAFWWIIGAVLCLLPGAIWNYYHTTMQGTPKHLYWLEVGCNDKLWFRV